MEDSRFAQSARADRVAAAADSMMTEGGRRVILFEKMTAGQKNKDVYGVTDAGQPCALFVADHGYGSPREFTVVVGTGNGAFKPGNNDYIGFFTSQVKTQDIDANHIFLVSNESWGNESKRNVISITLEKGIPVRAVGVSDIKTISCNLK